MRARKQSPALATVDELPSEEGRGRPGEPQRRVLTAFMRPRTREELPQQDDTRIRDAGGRKYPGTVRSERDEYDEQSEPYESDPPPTHSKYPRDPESYPNLQRGEGATLPYKSRINPPQPMRAVGQYEELVGAFQSSMRDLTAKMDRSFQQMSSKLYQMSRRLDSAQDRVESLDNPPVRSEREDEQPLSDFKKSYIHPPITAATQTVTNAEVQATDSSSIQRKPSETQSRNPPSQHSKAQSFQSSVTPVGREVEPRMKDFETQTPADKSGSVQEEMIDQLTTMWLETLELLKANNVKAAYRKVLETGDDIYLLRLIHKTGVCLKDLDVTTGLTVIRRLGQIMHSYFLESLGLQWIEETVQKGVFPQLPSDVQKGLIDALYAMSAMPSEEGVAAAQLYTYLTSPQA